MDKRIKIIEFIEETKKFVVSAFELVESQSLANNDLGSYRPKSGGWSIFEIIEHISLTNHYLLILIQKGFRKAINNVNNLNLKEEIDLFESSPKNNKLEEVGLLNTFVWDRPIHMEPSGLLSQTELQEKLNQQSDLVLKILRELKNGHGVMYKTTMSVNDLGKLNVYEYIIFLSQHTYRHLEQIENIKKEFEKRDDR